MSNRERMLKGLALAVLTAMAWLGGAVNARAQADGRIGGNVRDSSGANVAASKVTIKNSKTGETRTAETNAQGYFIVGNLKPSAYTITVQKEGFANVEYPDMPLLAGQELILDFEFRPAGVTETVTVTGQTPVLDLSSASLGANVSEREVQGLPINGRQLSQLMLMAPGAQNAGDGTFQDIRFSGRANEQNVIKYDGIEGSAVIDSSPGNVNGENRTPFRLQSSLENVQEFRVESSSYPAEYGTGTGGQVNVITKSGTNKLHGAVFEYFRDDSLDSKNHFDSFRKPDDSVQSEGPQSKLNLNQFGGSAGGPIVRDKAFFFGSYEGYRLTAGRNIIEGVPSNAAWARTTNAAILSLRPAFLAPNAVILPGASSDADFDIAQLQDDQRVEENAFSGRLDFRVSNWSSDTRVFLDRGTNDEPDGVTGRTKHFTANPSNVVFNLQRIFGSGMLNEFKFGYNAAPSTYQGVAPVGFENILISLTGTVANTGIAGQAGASTRATPGQLVRVNSGGNGRSAPYDPYSLTFADTITRAVGNHFVKIGGDVRMIRMSTDQLGGITYTFPNINAFLNNAPTQVQYFGDLSEPSPYHNGASGDKHPEQEYYVGFAQDEWRVKPTVTLNYGLRYDYYAPLHERDNRIVKFNVETGAIDPDTTPFYKSKKNSFQPRIGTTFTPKDSTVVRAGFGIFVGPGQTEDQIQPIEAERISTTVSSGALNVYPTDPAVIRANFANNPNTRNFQPRAYYDDYTLPEKVYEYTASVQQDMGRKMAVTVAYIGAQGRNLFLRSIANRTVGVLQSSPTATASNLREFDVVTCGDGRVLDGRTTPLTPTTICAGSSAISKTSPFAEIDYKTSGGNDSYNAMQLSLVRKTSNGFTLNGQYTFGYSKGNTGGSNESLTAGNNARALSEYDYDDGYNNFDVRHTFNLSALYSFPGTGLLTGGWSVGGIANARSGLPIQVTIARNDIVYVDGAGNVWGNAAEGRTAVINTPGGGQSRAARMRPDVVPGVDPYVKDGGLVFLNPAAFTTPKPGTFGNLERNSIHGPTFRQIDMIVAKRFGGRTVNGEFRWEIFNIFNTTNFALPPATLPNALPGANESPTQANRTQPGTPFTATSAGSWGVVNSTVTQTVGLGTNRQMQLAFRLNF